MTRTGLDASRDPMRSFDDDARRMARTAATGRPSRRRPRVSAPNVPDDACARSTPRSV